jgi:hypothetical protein
MVARPPTPFAGNLSGNLNDQVRRIAEALSQKMDNTGEPTYSAVLLIAPDGSTWRMTVSNAGAIATTHVVRS